MKKIEKTAEDYQKIDRQIKELQAKQALLKKELIAHAEKSKSDFDEAFQLKFANGTYISMRVKDVVEGTKDNKAALLGYDDEFVKIQLDESKVIEHAPKDDRLRKFLTKNNLKIAQKTTFAVYAG